MAKTRTARKGESLGGYFRKVFAEHPEWLDMKSNELIKARFEQDHPGQEFTPKIRANMANIKSILRKKMQKGGARVGRPKAAAAVNSGGQGLEGLELAIDNCLSTARELDPVGLADVINYLRRARNALVWHMGQP
ncbi:MAG TPA: hypothetical protein VNK04_12700 [Gemmataceae bacterium]|nr:hypothetical protein [Gemmataceae bacterium]